MGTQAGTVQKKPAGGMAVRPSFFSSSPVSLTDSPFVSRDQIRIARKADLSEYLLRNHPGEFRTVGHSLCMSSRESLYIRKGFPGYMDFSTGDHGNPIDFLTRYLGYSFAGAVMGLSPPTLERGTEERAVRHHIPSPPSGSGTTAIKLPERARKPYRRLYAYLLKRGIPGWLIRKMVADGIIYQERHHGNAVFVNPQEDYCEFRGTLSYAYRPFHGCLKTSPDRFWYLLSQAGSVEVAYICEGAIDAISLYLIHHSAGLRQPAAYVSIGGVCNQMTINRIKSRIPAILAVDNDAAGALCRRRNPELRSIIPTGKDWNDDLNPK